MPVLFEQRGAVAILSLSRPESRNCWGQDFTDGLREHLERLALDDTVRVVVLTGDEDGRAFSAGADLKDPATHVTHSAEALFASFPMWRQFAARTLDAFPKPLIAAVNGYAIGIGCILSYCCDLIVASDRAEWRQPQASLGVMPAFGGSVRLARWIGKGHAMKLAMGFPLGADEAYRIGLAQWLVSHESLNRGLDIPNLDDASWVDVFRFAALGMTEESRALHDAWRSK